MGEIDDECVCVLGAVNDRALIERVCAQTALPSSVAERAMAHVRVLAVRSRTTNCLGASGEVSKHAVACALAAMQLAVPCDRAKLIALAGVPEATFQQTFALMQSLLRVKYASWRIFRLCAVFFFRHSPANAHQNRLGRRECVQFGAGAVARQGGAPRL